jgi:hypothetical protein
MTIAFAIPRLAAKILDNMHSEPSSKLMKAKNELQPSGHLAE